MDALQVLKGVNGIAQCYFTEKKDVVRHRLVQEIIKAYEAAAHPGETLKKTTPGGIPQKPGAFAQ